MDLWPGDRVTVRAHWCPGGVPATVMSPQDLDTWPQFQGRYAPNGMPGDVWVLVRYDSWPEDEWVPRSQVQRVTAPQDEPVP